MKMQDIKICLDNGEPYIAADPYDGAHGVFGEMEYFLRLTEDYCKMSAIREELGIPLDVFLNSLNRVNDAFRELAVGLSLDELAVWNVYLDWMAHTPDRMMAEMGIEAVGIDVGPLCPGPEKRIAEAIAISRSRLDG